VLYFLYTVHVLTCIFLILVVLLQRGKGADLSVFGGGSTQAAFGARGTATLLHKLTVGFFVAFMFTTIAIALFQSSLRSDSVLSGVADGKATEQPATPGAEATEDGATATDGAAAEDGATTPDGAAAAEATTGEVEASSSEAPPAESAADGETAGEAGPGTAEQ
jgi:preprotein translocase subunit SecG